MSEKQSRASNYSSAKATTTTTTTLLSSPATWMIAAGSVGLTVLGQYSWMSMMRLLRQQQQNRQEKHDTVTSSSSSAASAPVFESDATYLQRAHQLRLALTTPVQSRFRVVAVLVLENATCIYGANDEPSPTITGSICAERGAFLQYRLQQKELVMEQQNDKEQEQKQPPKLPMVHRIFIVTDSAVAPVPPGLLCREYMFGHPAMTATTPIVLQSANQTSTPWITNLQELYPYPSLTMQWTVEEHLTRGQAFAQQQQKHDASFKYTVVSSSPPSSTTQSSSFTAHHVQQVIEAAQNAAQWDIRDAVHPIRYGAAALTWRQGREDQTWRILHRASQRKALEYGATQDAVAQLLSILWDDDRNNSQQQQQLQKQQQKPETTSKKKDVKDNDDEAQQPQSILLAQVDQFGMVYAPFAPARSMLVEHGWGDTVFVVAPEAASDDIKDLTTTTTRAVSQNPSVKPPIASIVPARALAPFTPEWKQ